MSKARQFYQSLNPQQKEFVDKKTISTSVSIKHWLQFLNQANAYDHHIDQALKRTTNWIIAMVVILFVTLFVSFAVASITTDTSALLVILVVVIILITLIIKRRNLSRLDINNYMRHFFVPFLEVMKSKAGEEAKLSAALDFRNPEKVLVPVKYKETASRKRNVKLFKPKYIIAKVTLLDQSYLETVIADDLKVLSYQNARGKYKTKKKTVHHFYIKLTAARTVYRVRGTSLPPEITVDENETEYVLKLKGKAKSEGVAVLKPAIYFQGLQRIYDQLVPLDSNPDATQPASVPGSEIPSAALPLLGVVPAMVWTDSYFSNYDYDSTKNRGDVPLLVDEGSSLNMFDS